MSPSITTDRKWEFFKMPIFRTNYRILQLALAAAGYSEDRYSILEPVCNTTDRLETEGRKAYVVQIYINALALGVDLDTIFNANDCEYFISADATLNGTFAALTTALTGVNNDLTFTAKQRGTIGNLTSITYVVAGNNTPLTIAVAGRDITVNVATGAGGAATSLASAVATAIAANAAANALVSVANAPANTGAGIVIAMAKSFLTGGTEF